MARNHQAGDRGQANCSDGGQPPPASGTALIPVRFLPRPTVPPCILTATGPKNFSLRFASASSARSTDPYMALVRSVLASRGSFVEAMLLRTGAGDTNSAAANTKQCPLD